MASSRGRLTLLATFMASAVWLACGTDNGAAPETPEEEVEDPPEVDSGGSRPAFEAGFADAGSDSSTTNPEPDGGDVCIDKDDPGSSESAAKALPNQDDGDNSVKTVKGVLNGQVDVDFFKFRLTDAFGSSIDTDFEMQSSGVEMCVFVKCAAGATTVSCPQGVKKKSDIGVDGCCATGPSKAYPDWDCPGFTDNDTADFFIRIKQTQDKCTPYQWTYRF